MMVTLLQSVGLSLRNFDNFDSMLQFRVFPQEYTSPTHFGKFIVFEFISISFVYFDYVKHCYIPNFLASPFLSIRSLMEF